MDMSIQLFSASDHISGFGGVADQQFLLYSIKSFLTSKSNFAFERVECL